ncbi:endonuclease domain-containing protein [Chiayiivirga flava]|uniref:Very-short-patch-repair endonuclease n=1 Tax=Chiayiivirga flava TaxID=659595 RepID=A0A7W8D757_9GAMM|nr:endonuclease domain-containing protein [Chiayiivirga flava]MBB5209186.1 very-short-patch-repair endonuclease [Chiayiivirga flava]
MPDAERELWFHLRGGRLLGLKFRRQYPMPPYVVDFICIEARLIVELDGSQHSQDVDRRREDMLKAQGFRVVRFWNNEVLSNTEAVLEAIISAAGCRTLTPTPLPGGEGL